MIYKILLIENHPVVRQNYNLLIAGEGDMEVCGEAASGADALSLVARTHPHVAVLDISLQSAFDGLHLLQHLHEEHPDLKILVVSGHDERFYGERVLEMGACGYVMKGDALAFLEGLRVVAQGRVYGNGMDVAGPDD